MKHSSRQTKRYPNHPDPRVRDLQSEIDGHVKAIRIAEAELQTGRIDPTVTPLYRAEIEKRHSLLSELYKDIENKVSAYDRRKVNNQ